MVGGSTRSGLLKNYIENLIFKSKYSQLWNSTGLFFRNQARPVLKNLMTRRMIRYPVFDPVSKILGSLGAPWLDLLKIAHFFFDFRTICVVSMQI